MSVHEGSQRGSEEGSAGEERQQWEELREEDFSGFGVEIPINRIVFDTELKFGQSRPLSEDEVAKRIESLRLNFPVHPVSGDVLLVPKDATSVPPPGHPLPGRQVAGAGWLGGPDWVRACSAPPASLPL